MGIEFKMSGVWINEFLLYWFDVNVESFLRKILVMNGYDL